MNIYIMGVEYQFFSSRIKQIAVSTKDLPKINYVQ